MTDWSSTVGRGREGSAVGAVVGAIVGAFIPGVGPVTGAIVGSSLGSAYDSYRASQRARKENLPNFGTGSGSPRYGFGALQNTTTNEIPIAVAYGRIKLAGNHFFQDGPGTTVNRGTGLSEGEVDRIYDIRINNKPADGFFPGTDTEGFVGTTTQVPSTKFDGNVEGLTNLAYVAQTLQASAKLSGTANLTAWVDGIKVKTFDGTAWSAGTSFSRNPAAILRDYLIDVKYGVALAESLLDDDAFGEVFDHCAVLITNSDGFLDQFNDIDGERSQRISSLHRQIEGVSDFTALAQSFQPEITAGLAKVELALAVAGNPDSLNADPKLQVTIRTDDATNDTPSDTILATATVVDVGDLVSGPSASPGPTKFVTFTFTSPPALTAGTTFWIVLEVNGVSVISSNDYYVWKSETPEEGSPDYLRGRAARQIGGTWSSLPAADRSFRAFMDKQPRFLCDLVIDSFRPHLDHIEEILSTGNMFLVTAGQKLKLRIEKDEASVATVTEDEMIGGSFSFSQAGASELVNRVSVQYMEPTAFFTKAEAQAEDKVDQDNRGKIERTESILGITNFNQASRMAEFLLNLEKFASIFCSFRVDIRQLKFEPGDVIAVTQEDAFFSSAKFRIISIQEFKDDEMEITCRAHNASLYDDTTGSTLQLWDAGDPADPFGPPEIVTNFQVNVLQDTLRFSWTAVLDIDLSHYEIRQGSSWESSQVLVTGITDTFWETQDFPPAGTHTYFIKAFDVTGSESVEPDQDSIAISGIFNRNVIKSFDEWAVAPDFSGTFTGDAYQETTELHDSETMRKAISLKTVDRWNTKTGTWATAETNGDTWERPVSKTAGTYETSSFDLGSKMKATIRLDAEFVIEPGGSILIEIALSDDDIIFGAFTPYVTGEYTTRFFKLKFTLSSPGGSTRVKITDLKIDADAPIRVEEFLNQSVAVAGTAFDIDPDFITLQAITVTTVGSSALVPVITTQSVSSFTVKIFDDNGVDVGGSINATARGFGEAA